MQKNENNLRNKSHLVISMLFLLEIQIAFILQDNASPFFLRLASLRELFVFYNPIPVSRMYKTLRAIAGLFFSNVFQSFIFNGYFIPSQLCLFINGIMFEAHSGCDLIPL